MSAKMYVQQPISMAQHLASPPMVKPHNACDECRARKLKCSGEPTGCSRCVADGVACLYSPRKQMGRPRKRRREEETQDCAYDPWDFGSNGGPTMRATSQPGSSILLPSTCDPQLPANGFTGMDGISTESLSFDNGRHMARMGYGSLSQDPFASAGISDVDPAYDSLQSFPTPNTFSDYSEWMPVPEPVLPLTTMPSAQTQLQTPPTTIYHNSSSPEVRSPEIARCDCLPTLYKTLSIFPSTSTPTFPDSMRFLKEAVAIGRSMLKCTNCPNSYNTALQNGTGLGTLLNLVIMEYTKLLKHIDERSQKEDKFVFRMGEMITPQTQHLHTRTLSCPMGISVDLSGPEWRIIARTAVRKEVFGDDTGNENVATLLDGMKERQVRWHSMFSTDSHIHEHSAASVNDGERGGSECICTQVLYIDRLKRALKDLGL